MHGWMRSSATARAWTRSAVGSVGSAMPSNAARGLCAAGAVAPWAIRKNSVPRGTGRILPRGRSLCGLSPCASRRSKIQTKRRGYREAYYLLCSIHSDFSSLKLQPLGFYSRSPGFIPTRNFCYRSENSGDYREVARPPQVVTCMKNNLLRFSK